MQSVIAGKVTPLAEELHRVRGKAGAGLLHVGALEKQLCDPAQLSKDHPSCHSPGKALQAEPERCSPEQKKLIDLQIALLHCCFGQPRIHGGDCDRVGAVGAGHAQGEQISHQHQQNRHSSGLWGFLAFGAAPLCQKDSGSKGDQCNESFQSTPRDTRGAPGS